VCEYRASTTPALALLARIGPKDQGLIVCRTAQPGEGEREGWLFILQYMYNMYVGVCVFGGWLNWPHLAQLVSGGLGLQVSGALGNQCTAG